MLNEVVGSARGGYVLRFLVGCFDIESCGRKKDWIIWTFVEVLRG